MSAVTSISDIVFEHYPKFFRQESIDAGEEQGRSGRISPSKIVNGCLLAPYYDLIGADQVPESREYDNCLVLETGKFLHAKLQKFLRGHYESLGWSYMDEVGVTITEHCRGSIDALVVSPEMEIEMHEYKTCSTGVMDSLGSKPAEHNAKQAQLYMMGVQCTHTRLFYINRNNFQMKEYVVPPDPQVQAELRAHIEAVEQAAATKTPPPPTSHWMGTSPCTRTCSYRHLCPETKKTRRKI